MGEVFISQVLALIKKNKDFPNYQAERRIDIFINHFLGRILHSYDKKIIISETIIPEFPLLKKKSDSKRPFDSTKIDYLCNTPEQIIFIELKTDVSSLKESQADIYFEHLNWESCLQDFDNLVINAEQKKSKYLPKYQALQKKLHPLANYKGDVRIIYLAPLDKNANDLAQKSPDIKIKIGKYSIVKHENFSKLSFDKSSDEKLIWDFICSLDMFIFELEK